MNQGIQKKFFSNGNLIITGEYFVLTGARALTVPLTYGQTMEVKYYKNFEDTLQWIVYEQGKLWFNVYFNCKNLNILSSSNVQHASGLQKILKHIQELKPGLIEANNSCYVTCNIDFNTSWGWGSSSTLISNLANWAGLDPFELNEMVSSGSGYDIAASSSQTPVFYQVNGRSREIIPVAFDPPFKESIYFVYLGKKQNTSESIELNLKAVQENKKMIPSVSDLTEKIALEQDVNEFMRYILEHEKIVSKTLNIPRVKEEYFNDFEGEIKSLGAWGGDCAMAVTQLSEERVKDYFNTKGLETVFKFKEIVKN